MAVRRTSDCKGSCDAKSTRPDRPTRLIPAYIYPPSLHELRHDLFSEELHRFDLLALRIRQKIDDDVGSAGLDVWLYVRRYFFRTSRRSGVCLPRHLHQVRRSQAPCFIVVLSNECGEHLCSPYLVHVSSSLLVFISNGLQVL